MQWQSNGGQHKMNNLEGILIVAIIIVVSYVAIAGTAWYIERKF